MVGLPRWATLGVLHLWALVSSSVKHVHSTYPTRSLVECRSVWLWQALHRWGSLLLLSATNPSSGSTHVPQQDRWRVNSPQLIDDSQTPKMPGYLKTLWDSKHCVGHWWKGILQLSGLPFETELYPERFSKQVEWAASITPFPSV